VWKIEMDEKIAKVKAEAAANLVRSWAAWQAEQKEKARAGNAVDIEKERARWQQESAAVLAQAQRDWSADEAERLAVAEARWQEQAELAAEKTRASSKAMRERGDAIELRRLREELLAMQNLLAERDGELSQAKAGAGGKVQPSSRQEIEAAVAKAQKEWKEAEAVRLTAAQAQAKAATDKSEAEARRLRDELSATQTKLTNRERELAQSQLALKETQERGRRGADETLTKAEASWKARESDRLTAVEAQWQEQSTRLLAEERARAKTELDAALAQARQRWAAESEATLGKAEANWKLREADRLMTAEVEWNQKSSKALAEARAEAQAARDENAVELVRLRAELTNAQAKLSERDTALAEARARAERVREEGKVALADAEKSWRSAEATKIAAVEKRLREQSGSALSEAETARSEAEIELRNLREHAAVLETTLADRELELTQAIARINATERQIEELRENEDIQVRRVKGEVTQLQAQLAEREEELAQARLFTERSYERWKKQAEADLAKAQKTWKAAEASKLAAARAEWQEEYRKSLEDTLSAERRAGRLPPARMAEDVAGADIAESNEDRPMPVFEPPVQTPPYTSSKPAFADARAAADQALDRLAMDAYQLLASPAALDSVSPADTRIIKGGLIERRNKGEGQPNNNKSLIVSGVVAAALAAAAAVVFFLVWPPEAPATATPQQVTATAKPIAPALAELPKATVANSVNVRSGPSTAETIMTTLKAGAQVVTGERKGGWVHVTVAAADGKPELSGWMVASSLQSPERSAAPQSQPEAQPAQPQAVQPAPPEPELAAEEQQNAPPSTAPEPEATQPAAPAPEPETQAAPGGQVIQSTPVGE
jgi:uncharacterized protein YraI